MVYRCLFLLIALQLYSQANNNAAAAGVSSLTTLYGIDSGIRGTEIVNTFNSLSHASGTNTPEVMLQTSLPSGIPYQTYQYIVNGRVPYVQSITQTTYNTLLIVAYQPQNNVPQQQYIVLPPEQISALLYFPKQSNLPTSGAPFTASVIAGTLPYFSVDPRQRAADIVSATTKLLNAPFKTSSQTQVWIQTTLTGPFNPAIPNGLLKNVLSASYNNNLIQINFLPPPPYTSSDTLTIFVAPEQVQQITYLFNYNFP